MCGTSWGTFPDYEKVISKDNDQKASFDHRELSDVVHRVSLLTGDRAPMVKWPVRQRYCEGASRGHM